MTVTVRSDPDVYISGDADELARVFSNLLRNASVYGDENSPVDIDVTKNENHVLIVFRSRGPEIPEAQLKLLFDKFYRLRREGKNGTGLGLAISKKIIELHRGRITAQSNPTTPVGSKRTSTSGTLAWL